MDINIWESYYFSFDI